MQKSLKYSLLSIMAIIPCIIIVVSIISYQKRVEKMYNFGLDIAQSLVVVHKSFVPNKTFSSQSKGMDSVVEEFQIGKMKLEEHKKYMEKWIYSKKEFRDIAKKIIESLDLLIEFMDDAINHGFYDKHYFLVSSAKFTFGRNKLLNIAIDYTKLITKKEKFGKIYLSKKQAKKIIDYIEMNFKDDFDSKENTKPAEVWGALLIRNYLKYGTKDLLPH